MLAAADPGPVRAGGTDPYDVFPKPDNVTGGVTLIRVPTPVSVGQFVILLDEFVKNATLTCAEGRAVSGIVLSAGGGAIFVCAV